MKVDILKERKEEKTRKYRTLIGKLLLISTSLYITNICVYIC